MWWKRTLVILVVIAIFTSLFAHGGMFARVFGGQEAIASEVREEPNAISLMEETEATEPTETQTIVTEPEETEPEVTEFVYVEKFEEVPHYFQTDYPDTPYGRFGDTVATDGCGITSLAMVLSYLLDEEILPDRLAEEYGRYCTGSGSSYKLFPAAAKDYGVTIEKQGGAWSRAVETLKNGQVIIAHMKGGSIFTTGGHFIVLDGITEDGRILVKDPYIGNYAENKDKALREGFEKGFEQKYIAYNSPSWWIFAPKDVDALAAKAEELHLATNN